MDKTGKTSLRCHLYFYAVFSCFEELLRLSDKARVILGDEEFIVCFKTLSGLRTSLGFEKGSCQFYGSLQTPADIELLFFSTNQAVRLFDGKVSFPPLPTKGIRFITKMNCFQKLGELLQTYTEPDTRRLNDEAYKEKVVELSLCAAFAVACQLATHEKESISLLAGKEGTVQLCVGNLIRSFWIRFDTDKNTWGRGTPKDEITAVVDLLTFDTAIDALLNRLDQQVAVGLGKIKTRGVAPFADLVGLLLERVSFYF